MRCRECAAIAVLRFAELSQILDVVTTVLQSNSRRACGAAQQHEVDDDAASLLLTPQQLQAHRLVVLSVAACRRFASSVWMDDVAQPGVHKHSSNCIHEGLM